MAELYTNDPSTTLAVAMGVSDTTLTVASGAQFPSTPGTFRIRIDDEIMTVTAVSGATWTVTRASEVCAGAQTAATHAINSPIYGVLTAGSLAALATSGGTVTSFGFINANGVIGSVASPSTTPTLTIALGAITPTSIVASGTITGSNLTGTNTGDQTITLTGDVTGSGSGSFAATIGSHVVAYSKMQQASGQTLLGNPTGSTANVQEISLGTPISFTGTTLTIGIIPTTLGGLGADTSGYTLGQIPVAQGTGSYAAAGRSGFFAGHGSPAAGLGYPTDYYLDLDSGTIYLKS